MHITDIDKATQEALGLKSREGALVPQVEAGSAADKAGIRAGDVIVSLDGVRIRKAHDLPIRVARHKPGDKVKVGIIRDGKPKTIIVEVEEMPEEHVVAGARGDSGHGKVRLGIVGESLTKELRRSLEARVKQGVVVKQVQPGSPAARAGIQRGDVIYRINGEPVQGLKSLGKILRGFEPGDVLRVMLDRHGDQVFALVRLPKVED